MNNQQIMALRQCIEILNKVMADAPNMQLANIINFMQDKLEENE